MRRQNGKIHLGFSRKEVKLMATPEFVYQDPLPIEKDSTHYRLLTKDYVSVTNFEGNEILKIDPQALTLLANVAIRDVSFLLRTAHLEKVAAILKDPQASKTIAMLPWRCCVTPTPQPRAFCRFARTPARPPSLAKKGQRSGPA